MSLSDRLRTLRRSRSWTQQGLAAALTDGGLPVTQAAVSSWEHGRRPSQQAIGALACVYALNPAAELELYRLAAEAQVRRRKPVTEAA